VLGEAGNNAGDGYIVASLARQHALMSILLSADLTFQFTV